MIASLATQIAAGVISIVERLTHRPQWRLQSAVLATALSLLSAFPDYDTVFTPDGVEHWQALRQQCANPLAPRDYPYGSHASKIAFRLTVPTLAHVLHLDIYGLLALQLVCLVAMFY